MAKIDALLINLHVNTGTEEAPVWKFIGCSTSDGFTGSTDNVEIATKCNNGFKENLPGSSSWEFSNSGYAETELGDNMESYSLAEELFRTRAVKQYKIAHEDESLYYRMGKGYISSYSESSPEGEFLQFEITVMGSGEYVVEPPAAV